MNLIYKDNIRAKITKLIPIRFGEIMYSQEKLYSYTIFENYKAKEINFESKNVLIYSFDSNNFLSEISKFNSDNTLIDKTKFELIESYGKCIKFRDWTPQNGDGNHGILEYSEETKLWNFFPPSRFFFRV